SIHRKATSIPIPPLPTPGRTWELPAARPLIPARRTAKPILIAVMTQRATTLSISLPQVWLAVLRTPTSSISAGQVLPRQRQLQHQTQLLRPHRARHQHPLQLPILARPQRRLPLQLPHRLRLGMCCRLDLESSSASRVQPSPLRSRVTRLRLIPASLTWATFADGAPAISL